MSDASPFSELGLSMPLLRALAESNYVEPTPIQRAAIPAVLRGADVLASAQTGSGKTAAFALPLLQHLHAERNATRSTSALILVPTRELAIQVSQFMQTYSRYLAQPFKILSVFGGVSINPQMLALRGGADVVIATPGRLLDLLDHNALHLADVRMLVLDEADRLLDLGFADELQRIVALLPTRRQTLLFSATFPDEVQTLATALLHEPERLSVEVNEHSAPDIRQRALSVATAKRTPLLRHLISSERWSRVLVFVATQYATEHVADKLRRVGIKAAALHGELSQGARMQALRDFKAGNIQVLVATDVAARGIDIVQLPAVVNYDLPRSPVDYTHRIGRTGRAGETGVAVSFVTTNDEAHFRLIEKRQHLHVPREVIAGFEPDVAEVSAPAATNGGVKGKRKSKKDKLREAAARVAAQSDDASPMTGADVWARRKPGPR